MDETRSSMSQKIRHEFEELKRETEAAESTRKWRECLKNPGHCNFIPVSEVTMDNLPENHRSEDVLEAIRLEANLTVRLRVGEVSKDRPESIAVSDDENQCVGTGRVVSVLPGHRMCSCFVCSNKKDKVHIWWCVDVLTAGHVIFTSKEAKKTRVDFFYDDENSLDNGRMKKCWGVKVLHAASNYDSCYVRCALHDAEVASKLAEDLKNLLALERKICKPLEDSTSEQSVVIVSHPHGQPKKVTIGSLKKGLQISKVEFFVDSLGLLPLWSGTVQYTADTCPGSSGAHILCLDFDSTTSRTLKVKDSDRKLWYYRLAYKYLLYGWQDIQCMLYISIVAFMWLNKSILPLVGEAILAFLLVTGTMLVFLRDYFLSRVFSRVWHAVRFGRSLPTISLRSLWHSHSNVDIYLAVYDYGSLLIILASWELVVISGSQLAGLLLWAVGLTFMTVLLITLHTEAKYNWFSAHVLRRRNLWLLSLWLTWFLITVGVPLELMEWWSVVLASIEVVFFVFLLPFFVTFLILRCLEGKQKSDVSKSLWGRILSPARFSFVHAGATTGENFNESVVFVLH